MIDMVERRTTDADLLGRSRVRVRGREVSDETPVWLEQGRWPIFAWLHEPASAPRGAVVLVPPLLGEQAAAFALYRVVARAVARRGLVAVRFDYRGTGDSGGALAGSRSATAWFEGVDQAVMLARARCAGPLALLGVRSGALVAAQSAVLRQDVDALVIWDPSSSGRVFLRGQRALQAIRVPRPDPSRGVEVPGFELDPATVEAIDRLELPGTLSARRALYVVRASSTSAGLPLIESYGDSTPGDSADVLTAVGSEQEDCFEVDPLRQQVPEATASLVVDWVSSALGELGRDRDRCGVTAAEDVDRRAEAEKSLRMARASEPIVVPPAVKEEVAVLERVRALGARGLFGIETVPHGRSWASGEDGCCGGAAPEVAAPATVLFLSSGNESHVGPVRLWVLLARRLAAHGIRSVRVDLSGLGESRPCPGRPEGVIRAIEAFDDVADLVDAVGGPERTVLAGLCSGAYQALESALVLKPLGVIGINPLLRFTPPELAEGGPVSSRRRLCQPRPVWVAGARRVLPDRLSRMLATVRRLLDGARTKRRRRVTWTAELAAAGVRIYCVCGEAEAGQLADAGLDDGTDERFHIDVLPGLDHGLVVASQRDAVIERVTRAVLAMAGVRSERDFGCAVPARPGREG